jgi:crotonobetainyl-CoA:carnitine CoA-transferase CaiB-like acyl-CoA transferase
VHRSPPALGDSTAALLSELGVDAAGQERLRQARVVA